jgi:histidinol dehydrogenase
MAEAEGLDAHANAVRIRLISVTNKHASENLCNSVHSVSLC